MKPNDYGQWEQTLMPDPCPFCGRTPEVLPSNPKEDGDAWGEVHCANENCHAQPIVSDGTDENDMRGPGAYKDAAILRWNTRHDIKGT